MQSLVRHSHWFIFVVGIATSIWIGLYVNAQIERKAQDAFLLKVHSMEAAIARRLRSYEDILFGIAGLYKASSERVTPRQFDSYGKSLNMKERFPSLEIINFAKYVKHEDRDEFLRKFADDTEGRGNVARLSLPAEREDYMVLTRAYPSLMTPTLGTDIFLNRIRATPPNSENILRGTEYLPDQAISSGIPLAPTGTRSPALAARLGIFETVEVQNGSKIAQLVGTAGIGFLIPSFFKEAIPDKLAKTLHYRMVNVGRTKGPKYDIPVSVFDSRTIGTGIDSEKYTDNELLKKHFDISFGGALFRIEVAEQRDASIERYEKFLPAGVFVGGLLFFGGIAMTSRRVLSDNAVLDAAVNERTIELQCEVNRTKSLERELAVVIESERMRIGRELHDDLGQRLTGISVSAEILSSKLHSIDPTLASQADDLGRATSDAMSQVRALAHGLMPVASGPEGLREALTHLASSISRLSGIRCKFDFDDPVDISDDDVSAHLYRIVQEAVNNAIRHAHARSIEIRLDEVDGKVALSISDNGTGFDRNEPSFRSGMGLNTITYRASIINYDLEISSLAGKGTLIKVTER